MSRGWNGNRQKRASRCVDEEMPVVHRLHASGVQQCREIGFPLIGSCSVELGEIPILAIAKLEITPVP
jgi:hypothetical protein